MNMQDAILKKLGLEVRGSYEEKRFRINQFCCYQGITVSDLFKILSREKDPCFVPLRKYGVELEGGILSTSEEFVAKLKKAGIPSFVAGSSKEVVAKWKIAKDCTVSIEGLNPVEIISPQLIGMGKGFGFAEVEKVLKIWNEELSKNGIRLGVNPTCGGHVHVDVYDYDLKNAFNLQLLVYCLWDLLKYLVPSSRRNNKFCKEIKDFHFKENFTKGTLTKDLFAIGGDRHLCLNLVNLFDNHVEFRFWPGTTSVAEVKMHVIISLCLTETAKKKSVLDLLKANERDYVTIEDLLDFIGVKGPHPVLQEVRSLARQKFYYFIQSAGVEGILKKEKVYEKLSKAFTEATFGIVVSPIHSSLKKFLYRKFLKTELKEKFFKSELEEKLSVNFVRSIVEAVRVDWEREKVSMVFSDKMKDFVVAVLYLFGVKDSESWVKRTSDDEIAKDFFVRAAASGF